jgi:hypothetical protein
MWNMCSFTWNLWFSLRNKKNELPWFNVSCTSHSTVLHKLRKARATFFNAFLESARNACSSAAFYRFVTRFSRVCLPRDYTHTGSSRNAVWTRLGRTPRSVTIVTWSLRIPYDASENVQNWRSYDALLARSLHGANHATPNGKNTHVGTLPSLAGPWSEKCSHEVSVYNYLEDEICKTLFPSIFGVDICG